METPKHLNIIQSFLPISPNTRPNKQLTEIRGIIIHYVGNTNSTAKANRNYWATLTGTVHASAHYIVDLNGDILHCIPDNEVAYHCGAKTYKPIVQKLFNNHPNNYTIGIEMTHIKDNGLPSEYTREATVDLVQFLMRKYDIPISNVLRHYDITGKICPKYYVDNPKEWDLFLEHCGYSV